MACLCWSTLERGAGLRAAGPPQDRLGAVAFRARQSSRARVFCVSLEDGAELVHAGASFTPRRGTAATEAQWVLDWAGRDKTTVHELREVAAGPTVTRQPERRADPRARRCPQILR